MLVVLYFEVHFSNMPIVVQYLIYVVRQDEIRTWSNQKFKTDLIPKQDCFKKNIIECTCKNNHTAKFVHLSYIFAAWQKFALKD